MDKLKQLQEKRDAIVAKMNECNEKRDFDGFDAQEAELRAVENDIKMLKIEMDFNPAKDGKRSNEDEAELRDLLKDAMANNRELDITDQELRDGEIVIGAATGTQKSTGNIAVTTFANFILKKLPVISPLYGACRKEILPGKAHSIPVQKNKLGKFVKTKELAAYAKQNADYSQVKLEPVKFTNLVVLSEEAIEDTGYNIESDIKDQILESYGETLDELIVIGDAADGVEGLNMFSKAEGAIEVVQAEAGKITAKELLAMYYGIKSSYRKNATWVFDTKTAEQLAGLEDANGRPLLTASYTNTPFGEGSTLLGRPVIINDNVDSEGLGKKLIFFGDLMHSIIIGPRKSLVLKRSEEFGFLDDSIALKASTRLDIKLGVQEAMCYYVGK